MRLVVVLLIALAGPVAAQTDGADALAVRDVFVQFRTAIAARDADAALAAVSTATTDHLGRILALAVEADSAEVAALPPSDRIEVLALRLRVPVGDLRALSGETVFAYTVRKGWYPPGLFAPHRIGEVEVSGDLAIGALLVDGAPTGSWVRFVRERDGWRYDLTDAFESFGRTLRRAVRDDGEDPLALTETLLENAYGAPVPASVWHPVGRD